MASLDASAFKRYGPMILEGYVIAAQAAGGRASELRSALAPGLFAVIKICDERGLAQVPTDLPPPPNISQRLYILKSSSPAQ